MGSGIFVPDPAFLVRESRTAVWRKGNYSEYCIADLHAERQKTIGKKTPNTYFDGFGRLDIQLAASGSPEAVSFLRNDRRIGSRFYLFYKRKIRGISFLPSGAATRAIRLKSLGTTPGNPKPLHGPAICCI